MDDCITIMMYDFFRHIKSEYSDKYVYEIGSVNDYLVRFIDYSLDFYNLKLLTYLITNDFKEDFFASTMMLPD